jgi:hypothetical protein
MIIEAILPFLESGMMIVLEYGAQVSIVVHRVNGSHGA